MGGGVTNIKLRLLAGVSALAIVVAHPESMLAADIPAKPALVTKAPPAAFRDRWSWWVEGGAIRVDGDPGVGGLAGFNVDPKKWGWEGAVGVEYRPGMSPWIWSAQFRYGRNGTGAVAYSNPLAVFQPLGISSTPVAAVGNNAASGKEYHWAADFMVGRDLGLGQGRTTARFGVRIAQIRGKTNGSAQWGPFPVAFTSANCATPSSAIPYCGSERRDYEVKNSFIGAGPRAAIDGQLPLGGNWALEYGVGVAALYGRRKAEQTVNITQVNPTTTPTNAFVCIAGCPNSLTSTSNGFVFNTDAMLGVSYAFSQNVSLLLNYRFDGYWNALRGFDSNGNLTNLDRFYHGPMLRLTATY